MERVWYGHGNSEQQVLDFDHHPLPLCESFHDLARTRPITAAPPCQTDRKSSEKRERGAKKRLRINERGVSFGFSGGTWKTG
jgi:hypothetical protein